ncbi:MAG TPA: peptidylprolyl isomerase [Saprospiraceae bacterium]|nr:peptidylprolyl isomerase [Saprospiraceae bacterium]
MKINTLFFVFMLVPFTAYLQPKANFSVIIEKKEAPTTVMIKNESKGAESYTWDFGDGTTAKDTVSSHRYTHGGNYNITLTAIKGKKSNTMTQTIHIDTPAKCLIEITTDYGVMTAELYDATPQHRDNFLKLAEEGFYNGLLFHRVIEGFMIQGGDPTSKDAAAGTPLGSGGPGYQVPAEFVDSLVHIKGAIAAARTGDSVNPEKKSSGSQFYIVQGTPVDANTLSMWERKKGVPYTEAQKKAYMEKGGTPSLDHEYTVFGHIVSGLDVLDKIAKVEKDGRDRPKTDVKMTIKVIR